ncbi:MAG TPA: dTDP-4-dehydrorhamnose reductase [Anaerolineales bacterium]|nr:dTDP-4-dehydrorhamnose reductase [Anaerolineales bacterium]
MKILIIGKNGQLGWELERSLAVLGEVVAVARPEIDLSNPESTAGWVRRVEPDVVVNAAAYTDVDGAERETGAARAVNARAPGVLAAETERLGSALIHYSTDFVFDGEKREPYRETDPTRPLGVYGRTKLEGEQAVAAAGGAGLIFRTAWVYSLRRPSFVTRVLEWARRSPELRIVTDQTGSPTWCRTLAQATARVIAMGGPDPAGFLRERHGLYHVACDGAASRAEWARAILRGDPHPEEQLAKVVIPALTSDFPSPAMRPAYSVLDCTKFADVFGFRLPPWEEALGLAMEAG